MDNIFYNFIYFTFNLIYFCMEEISLYRLKHKKTGLYYCQPTNYLSEIGTIYTENNIKKPEKHTQIKVIDKIILEKNQSLFKSIGIIGQYDYKGIPKLWYDYADENDFEIEKLID